MRSRLVSSFVVMASLYLLPTVAGAGIYAGELSKCLVASTTDADRNNLVKWMFAAIAEHPEVKSMSKVSPEQSEALSAGTARLFERLLTKSCLKESKEAVKYEGSGAIQVGFKVLGEVAAGGLFADPAAATYTASLDSYIDRDKLNELLGIR
jgi:hypothetical protein